MANAGADEQATFDAQVLMIASLIENAAAIFDGPRDEVIEAFIAGISGALESPMPVLSRIEAPKQDVH